MKLKPLFTLFTQAVNSLSVLEGTQRDCGQTLGFSSGKYSRTVGAGQQARIDADGADIPKGPLDIRKHLFQGVGAAIWQRGYILRPECADDQNRRALDPLSEMKQQTGRGRIDPVKVIQQDQQRVSLGKAEEHIAELLKDAVLVGSRIDHRPLGAIQELPDPPDVDRPIRSLRRQTSAHPRNGDESAEQIGSVLGQRFDRQLGEIS